MALIYNETNQPFRIIGIDPGIDTLGFSILDLDLETQNVVITLSTTFRGSQMERDYHVGTFTCNRVRLVRHKHFS